MRFLITVEKLLGKLVGHGIKIVVGGPGLHKEVKNIDVQEFPLKSERVLSNSLILTTLIGYKDEDEIIEQFEWYTKVGISAFGLHTVCGIEAPKKLLLRAKELGLVIFYIPKKIPYHIIYNTFIDLNLEMHLQLHHEIEKNYDLMLKGLMQNKGVSHTLKITGDYLNGPVVFWDLSKEPFEDLNKKLICLGIEQIAELELYIKKLINNHRFYIFELNNRNIQFYPVESNEDFYGYLIVTCGQDEKAERLEQLVIKNASNIIVLEYVQRKRLESYYKSKDVLLLEEILLNHQGEYIPYNRFHLSFESFKCCCVLKIESNEILNMILSRVQNLIEKVGNGLALIYEGQILIFATTIELFYKVIKMLGEENIFFGIKQGIESDKVEALRIAIEEAKKTAFIAKLIKKRVLEWEQIAQETLYLDLILNPSKNYEKLPFYNILESLFHKIETELWNTLIIYIENNYSFKESSKILHVHPNTIKYRVKKLEGLICTPINKNINGFNILFTLNFLVFKNLFEVNK